MNATLLVIGDELLSGTVEDKNVAFIARALKGKGIVLKEVRFIADDVENIAKTIKEVRQTSTYVFTTGGIGVTHDDVTVEAVCCALQRQITENEKILHVLQEKRPDMPVDLQKLFSRTPEGAHVISNAVNNVPSFYCENVFVLAGMPHIMRAMFQTVLPVLKEGKKFRRYSVTCNLSEEKIYKALTVLQEAHVHIKIGSYPFYETPQNYGVTFVLETQNPEALTQAIQDIRAMIKTFSGCIESETEETL